MELCEIRENINKLKKTSLLSPRREYYINRISQSLQIAFKEYKDDEELTKLSQEFCEERAENNFFMKPPVLILLSNRKKKSLNDFYIFIE